MLIYEKVAEIDSLLAQIQSEKQAGITEMKAELESALNDYQTTTSEAIDSKISQSQENLKSDYENSLAESIKSLKSENAEIINQTLTDIASVAKEEVKTEILENKDSIQGELLESLNKSVPLELLANACFNAKVLAGIEGTIESQMTTDKAKRVFKEALKEDVLVKDYYESFLRLQSLKIFGTHELIQGIIQAISKPEPVEPEPEPEPEPPQQAQNILIAR